MICPESIQVLDDLLRSLSGYSCLVGLARAAGQEPTVFGGRRSRECCAPPAPLVSESTEVAPPADSPSPSSPIIHRIERSTEQGDPNGGSVVAPGGIRRCQMTSSPSLR